MRTFLRVGRRGATSAAVQERLTTEFEGTDAELEAEIESLNERARGRVRTEELRLLMHLRNLAGIRRLEAADARSPRHPDADFGALGDRGPLPEVAPDELSAGLLRAAIERHGALLVRGLVPRPAAGAFADQIERCFAEREQHDTGLRHDAGYYAEFVPDPRYGVHMGRGWIKQGGGVLAADSPRLSFEMLEMLGGAGVPALVEGYLGEPPLISAEKTTLRKAEPSVGGAWHQDGKFMGQVNALNLWLALSRCGDDAPGLDVVPRRLEHHVRTETDEAMFDNMVSQRMAEEAAGDLPILRPVFEPGDALLFDELFLHKTGSDASMRRPRFAIESWFFGPSGFPGDYAPLAV
jgi:hypothetical protein